LHFSIVVTNPYLRDLLHEFYFLFKEPTQLPPPRSTDHHFPLLPNSTLVNMRSYQYPYVQKLEIEVHVTKMFVTGWIQPTSSPFSSPKFLFKKKDCYWCMFIDYRALNALMVCRNMPFCGCARRGSQGCAFQRRKDARIRHQRLFVGNVGKTEGNRSKQKF